MELNQEFYDLQNSFTRHLLESYVGIKQEFLEVVREERYLAWPETYLYNEGWNVWGLRFNNNDVPQAHDLCPMISSFILAHNALITTAGFSILKSGTVIRPHCGYSTDVLRCHLGVTVPLGDCYLRVGVTKRQWKEGQVMVFDDTIEHEAWNKTNETRIVMLFDLDKSEFLSYR